MNEKLNIVIGKAYDIHNDLGSGFLERVYQNALYNELISIGFDVEKEKPLNVFYKGECVGNYFADLVVDNKIIIETKTVRSINLYHIKQIKNYLKATNIDIGLIINFGDSVKVKRVYI